MSSEALLENPSIFSDLSTTDFDLTVRQIHERQLALANEYLDIVANYPPAGIGRFGSNSIVKAHIFKILYRAFSVEGNTGESKRSELNLLLFALAWLHPNLSREQL